MHTYPVQHVECFYGLVAEMAPPTCGIALVAASESAGPGKPATGKSASRDANGPGRGVDSPSA